MWFYFKVSNQQLYPVFLSPKPTANLTDAFRYKWIPGNIWGLWFH